MSFGKWFKVVLLMVVTLAVAALASVADSGGTVGAVIGDKAPGAVKLLGDNLILAIIGMVGALAFRLLQKALQMLPTRWKWVNNKLTVGLINKLIGWLFGKTTLIYNAKVQDDYCTDPAYSKEELKKKATEYLSKKGGVLKEFNKAINR